MHFEQKWAESGRKMSFFCADENPLHRTQGISPPNTESEDSSQQKNNLIKKHRKFGNWLNITMTKLESRYTPGVKNITNSCEKQWMGTVGSAMGKNFSQETRMGLTSSHELYSPTELGCHHITPYNGKFWFQWIYLHEGILRGVKLTTYIQNFVGIKHIKKANLKLKISIKWKYGMFVNRIFCLLCYNWLQ